MTFTYKHAGEIIHYYKFLLGRDLQNGSETPVTDIAVAPVNDDKLNKFFEQYKTAPDAAKALELAGYDKSQVQVILVHTDNKSISSWEEIDSYLEMNQLERVYLNPAFFSN